MGLKPQDCATLAEWRVYGLRKKQWQIAQAAFGDKTRQSWVSEIENGHMPKPYNDGYDSLLQAYRLDAEPEQFVRMVNAARKLKTLQTPAIETDPLFCQELLHHPHPIERIARIMRDAMNRRQA